MLTHATLLATLHNLSRLSPALNNLKIFISIRAQENIGDVLKLLNFFRRYRGEAYTGFWWENLRERDHWRDPGVDGRILKYFFKK
jgi:hypothetical protein